MLTQARVRELFDYRTDGELIWKVKPSKRIEVGTVAGYCDDRGYKRVGVDGKRYQVTSVIWLWHYGCLPECHLEYRNNNNNDSRIENLQEVSQLDKVKNPKLTQRRVCELFDYREDGELIRKRNRGPAREGAVAGCLGTLGYKAIKVDGKYYKTHRLVWILHHGYFPEHDIDHINRNKADNRIENLREVSTSCNMRNVKVSKVSKSGVTGVNWHEKNNKWQAQIMVLGKIQYLGLFSTILEAAKARWNAEVKYDFPNCNTTSSALKYIKEHENEKENDRGIANPRNKD